MCTGNNMREGSWNDAGAFDGNWAEDEDAVGGRGRGPGVASPSLCRVASENRQGYASQQGAQTETEARGGWKAMPGNGGSSPEGMEGMDEDEGRHVVD